MGFAAQGVFSRHVAQQVANDTLHAGVQRAGFDVVHQPVQPAGNACQHAHAKTGVYVDFVQDDLFAHAQQQRVGQRLRVQDVRLARKHQRFGKAVTWADQFNHLFLAGR